MKLKEVGAVFKYRWMQVLGALVLTAVVVAGSMGAMSQQPAKPDGRPVVTMTKPPALFSKAEMDKILEHSKNAPVPLVAAGRAFELPGDAKMDGLVMHRSSPVETPKGMTIEPLPLPVYLIVRSGEVANISRKTGEFQIGEGHEKEFQFLIDQLGIDKMQLVDKEFYEKRWGPHREDYEEGSK